MLPPVSSRLDASLPLPEAARLPVLVYHHVGPPSPGTWPSLTVTADRFRSQMCWLARLGHVGIRPADWAGRLHQGTRLPARPVLITFDDAYADITEYALPVLEELGFGAGIFITTGRMGGRSIWDEAAGLHSLPLMSADQIKEWSNRGMEFGAHSRTHPDLTGLSTDAIDEEVIGSREDLKNLLGSPPSSFAYPYGRVDPRVRSRVAVAFELAFVVQTGRGVNTLLTDPHIQLRSLVEPDDSALDVLVRTRFGVPVRELLRRSRP